MIMIILINCKDDEDDSDDNINKNVYNNTVLPNWESCDLLKKTTKTIASSASS